MLTSLARNILLGRSGEKILRGSEQLMDLNELTVELMQPLVGTTFRLDAPNGQTYPLQLVSVTK